MPAESHQHGRIEGELSIIRCAGREEMATHSVSRLGLHYDA